MKTIKLPAIDLWSAIIIISIICISATISGKYQKQGYLKIQYQKMLNEILRRDISLEDKAIQQIPFSIFDISYK